jgi:hypothetical protein
VIVNGVLLCCVREICLLYYHFVQNNNLIRQSVLSVYRIYRVAYKGTHTEDLDVRTEYTFIKSALSHVKCQGLKLHNKQEVTTQRTLR